MAKRSGTYKSEKRKKELSRLKKQEEKRQRRFSKGISDKKDTDLISSGDEDKEQQN